MLLIKEINYEGSHKVLEISVEVSHKALEISVEARDCKGMVSVIVLLRFTNVVSM